MVGLALLIMLAGLVGLIKPAWIRLPNRWVALILLVGGFILAGVDGGEEPAQPTTGQPTQADVTETAPSQQEQESEPEEEASAEPEPEPAPAGIGDPVQAGDMVLTVLQAVRSSGNEFNRPDEDHEFLLVEVELRNEGRSNRSYNALFFKIQSSEGNIESMDFGASVLLTSQNRKDLGSGELAPGGRVAGWIGFQVPAGDPAPMLVWEPSLFGQPVTVLLAEGE